jgi:hypothetical protein
MAEDGTITLGAPKEDDDAAAAAPESSGEGEERPL